MILDTMNPYDYPQEETILAQEKLILAFLLKLINQRFERTIFHLSPNCFAYATAFRFRADLLYGTSLRSIDGDDQGVDPLGTVNVGDRQTLEVTLETFPAPRNPYESPTIDHPGLMVDKIPSIEWEYTLPETNVAPENRPSQKEISIPTIHFQVLC